jgi:nucleoside-diphosphate-sugar epimerase
MILVTGATGNVGKELVTQLAAAKHGHGIRVRSGALAMTWPRPIARRARASAVP